MDTEDASTAASSRRRNLPNILITGTPGTGKSTLAKEAAERTHFNYVDISAFTEEHGFFDGHDEDRDAKILNEDAIIDELDCQMVEGGNIVDYHGSEFFPERWFDAVIVLRTQISTLYDRLEQRGYAEKKISENVQCEIFQVLLDEAKESYSEEIVRETDNNTPDDLEQNLELICNYVTSWTQSNTTEQELSPGSRTQSQKTDIVCTVNPEKAMASSPDRIKNRRASLPVGLSTTPRPFQKALPTLRKLSSELPHLMTTSSTSNRRHSSSPMEPSAPKDDINVASTDMNRANKPNFGRRVSLAPYQAMQGDQRSETDIFQVTLLKSFLGLGITIKADSHGYPIICELDPVSPASRHGCIKVNDAILSVNDIDLVGRGDMRVQQVLRTQPRGVVNLVLAPPAYVKSRHEITGSPGYESAGERFRQMSVQDDTIEEESNVNPGLDGNTVTQDATDDIVSVDAPAYLNDISNCDEKLDEKNTEFDRLAEQYSATEKPDGYDSIISPKQQLTFESHLPVADCNEVETARPIVEPEIEHSRSSVSIETCLTFDRSSLCDNSDRLHRSGSDSGVVSPDSSVKSAGCYGNLSSGQKSITLCHHQRDDSLLSTSDKDTDVNHWTVEDNDKMSIDTSETSNDELPKVEENLADSVVPELPSKPPPSLGLFSDPDGFFPGEIREIELLNGPLGLGFSLEGGKGSIFGDVPVRVKKLFKGGTAERTSCLHVGDEILTINGQEISNKSHYDAWNLIKSLPDGVVFLSVKRKAMFV